MADLTVTDDTDCNFAATLGLRCPEGTFCCPTTSPLTAGRCLPPGGCNCTAALGDCPAGQLCANGDYVRGERPWIHDAGQGRVTLGKGERRSRPGRLGVHTAHVSKLRLVGGVRGVQVPTVP